MIHRGFWQTGLIRLAYILLDVLAISLAFYFACLLRPQTIPFPVTLEGFFLSPQNPYRLIFALWLLVIAFFNQTHNLYQTLREILETAAILEIIKSVISATFVFIVLSYLLRVHDFPRSVAVLINVLLIVFL